MFIRRCWPWLWPTSKARASTSLRGASLGPPLTTCDCYQNGSSSRRWRKWSWNPLRNIGNRFGSTGTVLEADLPEAGRCWPDVRIAASGTGAIESRAAGAEEGFPRCRATGEAARVPGADLELCARYRTATVANRDAQKVPIDLRPGTVAEPTGESAGRDPY